MPDLLLELFSEEIPARFQRRAAEDLKKAVTDALVEAGLLYESAKAFVTPRRLTLTVTGIPARSFREMFEAVAKAFPDRQVILRPHPAERIESWADIPERCPNAKVIYEGNVLPWLLGLAGLTLMYRLLPNAPVRWRDAFIGAALATVILLVSQAPHRRLEWIAALTVAIGIGAVVLLLADRIQHLLGERFVMAMERLMGLILVAVAVEMLVRALKTLGPQLHG